jgi:hypothetical protein
MFVKQLTATIEDFESLGYRRSNSFYERDFTVRFIEGRNGEAISILEEFDLRTGVIQNVFWRVDYDPATRVAMIYS